MLDDHPTFTGVLEAFDITTTLNTALSLHPAAGRFVVISDQTLTGISNKQLFMEAIANISRPMDLLILDNHTMAEVREQVGLLSEKDIALWLSFNADRAGNYYSFSQSAALISSASKAPLYSFWDFHLGHGIVGGKLASGYSQGRKAAELALRILQGTPVADIPVVTDSPNRHMYDYLQLARFNIDEKMLPPDSVVINKPRTFYSQYKNIFWGVAAGFMGLSMIIMLLLINISSRKRFIKELQMSEGRFRTLFDSAASGIALLDINGNFLRVNAGCCRIFGYSVQEMEQKSWQDITHPDDMAATGLLLADVLKGVSRLSLEKRYIHKEGRIVWALLNVGLHTDLDGRPLNYVSQMQDITQRKEEQAKMRIKEARYRQLFEADLSGFYIANPSGRVLLCNKVFADILGFSTIDDVVGLNVSPYYRHSHVWTRLIDDLWQRKKIENTEVELLRGGKILTVLFNAIGRFDDQGQLLEIQGHVMDISRQKKLETQLVRAQKMEAMGLMAGGVAHDLNNILSGITGYPELMLATLAKDSALRKPLQSIRDSGQRAAAVVADLLTVARSAANARAVHNVYILAKEYLGSPECEQFRALYPDISVHLEGKAEDATILCSPIHIKKCLMNLVTNGLEAIESNGRVVITVSTKTVNKGREGGHVAADYVILSVHDSGTGISEEDRSRIFEPFYTKKVMGKSGTGLGLAVVWNTVQDHGGIIKVDSNGQGTTFTLSFPRYMQVPLEVAKEDEIVSSAGNGERILIVDDEPLLRDLAGQILTNLGYHVDAVESGEAALLFLQEQTVDLVLLDMFMEPGINGCQTYERIIVRHPGQKAIIASGFSKSDDVKKAMRLGVGNFIEKPYSMAQLGRAVRELL
jgi:PAS domain S-box-containing protein